MSDSPFSRIGELMRKKKYLVFFISAALLVLALLFFSEEEPRERDSEDFDEAAYVKNLEERTSALLSRVEGAGEVHVMITMENAYEAHYAADHVSDETKTEGVEDTSQKENVVLQTEKSGVKSPIVESISRPRVRGVSVVCKGGGNATVQMKIISLLSSLFDLDTNRISVTN